MCKAEAPNPVYHPASKQIDHITQALLSPPNAEASAATATTPNPNDLNADIGINTEFLIQVQPIRVIVFSRPRILPGNPRLVDTNPPIFPSPHNSWSKRVRVDDHLRGQQEGRESPHLRNKYANANRVEAREGEKMVLECAARGNPPPQLIWFKGGGGSSLPPPICRNTFCDLNFDVGIHEALNYLPFTEAVKYLGTKVAEDGQLFPTIVESPFNYSQSDVKPLTDMDGANLSPKEIDFSGTRLDRFSVIAGLRKDDTGALVIAVSRLIVDNLRASDATRYTCLALLKMEPLGGHGNWTDVKRLV